MQNVRRYKDFTSFVKQRFGFRVQKVCINAGFTCPNKDGTKGVGGCTYCNNNTFNPDYCKPIKSIKVQIDEGIEFFSKKYKPYVIGKIITGKNKIQFNEKINWS